MDELLDRLLDHLARTDPGGVVGVYLYGSAVADQLRPDSDIDVLVVARRSLVPVEREMLVHHLLGSSGWRGHAGRFPEAADRRPVDLTVVLADEIRGGEPPRTRDLQFGEWLRAEFLAGELPGPETDPDVTMLIASALAAHRVLRGPALEEISVGIAPAALARAAVESVPQLLADVDGDERNVLLTLARILVTVETGALVSKDVAAASVVPRLPVSPGRTLERARAGYLGESTDDWAGEGDRVGELAAELVAMIRRVADH